MQSFHGVQNISKIWMVSDISTCKTTVPWGWWWGPSSTQIKGGRANGLSRPGQTISHPHRVHLGANENWKTVWAQIPKSPVFGMESYHIQWFLSAQDIIQLWIIFKLKFLDNIILQSKSRETRLGSKVIGLVFLFDHCRSLMFLLRSLTRWGEWSSLPIP